jgi:NAD(P)-dependent dehydrogenase (short-subunit alcohol dehydrogenase family)
MQESPLAGKVALVTGGLRGIGAAIAGRPAADGADADVVRNAVDTTVKTPGRLELKRVMPRKK